MKVVDHGGPVLTRSKVVLAFRGSGWATGNLSPEDARRAFEAVLATPYMSHLVQYRGIRRAEIVASLAPDLRDIGMLGPDPRKLVANDIWLISDDEVLAAALDAAAVRPAQLGEDLLYMVCISQDPIPISSHATDANGFHSAYFIGDRRITYGVLFNQSALSAAALRSYLPGVFTHELVESCTDPHPRTGYILDDGVNEVCDMNIAPETTVPGLEQPVSLAAYWSELEQEAVVPTTYSLRVALGLGRQATLPSVRAVVPGSSVRAAVLAGCDP